MLGHDADFDFSTIAEMGLLRIFRKRIGMRRHRKWCAVRTLQLSQRHAGMDAGMTGFFPLAEASC